VRYLSEQGLWTDAHEQRQRQLLGSTP
jgi:hypothetical protein